MVVRLDSAAKHFCELSDWSLSNLALQKLLYLSQVEFAGKNNGSQMIDETFEAWDYGPVIPRLYRRLKMFGADDVSDVFRSALPIKVNTKTDHAIKRTWEQFGSVAPGELIEVTHWDRGGWAERYEPGFKNIRISHADIVQEAANRKEYASEWGNIVAA